MEPTNETVSLINTETQQKLIDCARDLNVSPNPLLNILIDDEIERQRLLKISAEIAEEESKPTAPSQKIAKICNQHLSALNQESENVTIRAAIENLYNDLLKQNLLSVNAREGSIVESKRLETSRTAYYWYAGILAKQTSMWFGALHVYLFHELFNPYSKLVFVGMPTNVEVSYQVFTHLYKLFKKIKVSYKKEAGKWGTKAEMEEHANQYIYKFAEELLHVQAYIENDDFNKLLYDYANGKYGYAMRR